MTIERANAGNAAPVKAAMLLFPRFEPICKTGATTKVAPNSGNVGEATVGAIPIWLKYPFSYRWWAAGA
jgi:hypothetical protein